VTKPTFTDLSDDVLQQEIGLIAYAIQMLSLEQLPVSDDIRLRAEALREEFERRSIK
jgi:hypothetical protein